MSTILNKYIDPVKKTIFIGKEEWKSLNEQYDRDVIKGWVIEEIMAGNIGFPHMDIDINDAAESFKKLCAYPCKPFQIGETMTRYDYKYPIGNKYLSDTLVGNDASNYFHQVARSYASGHNDPSPQESWASAHYMDSCLKGIWTLKMDKLDMKSIRSSMAMRKYWASQFRPSMAKSIYEKFHSVDVLDFSAGWGDRLCGFYACKNTKSYIGIDPNKAVYDNYFKQVDLYKTIAGEKKVTFYNFPAEDVVLDENIVDTVFTSPPYFCAETYTNDDTQSWVRYSEVDSWLEGFMYKTLDIVWKALKPGGHLIVNISDVHRKGKICKICDPMNDYIKDKLGGVLVDSFGMKLSKRPASHAYDGKSGVCVEPIWAWRKPGAILFVYDGSGTVDKSTNAKNKDTEPKMEHICKIKDEEHTKVAIIDDMEVNPKYEKPKVTPPKEIEWVVDELDDIDPRTFGRLIMEMKSKLPIPLVIVHGDEGCDDIIAKLCKGLEIQMKKLYNGVELVEECFGKKKLVKCQPHSKPEFEILCRKMED